MKIAPLIVRAQDVAPQAWRNGGGQTRELLTWPRTAGTGSSPVAGASLPWHLRISLAEVSGNGPFSVFAGVDRWFTVVEGAGVRLTVDGVKHPLDASSGPLYFAGEAQVHCDLIAGPTRDLNLMTARGTGAMLPCQSGTSWTSPLMQRGLFTRCQGRWAMPGSPGIELPAHALLWLEEAAHRVFSFEAVGADDRGPVGWWLGFSPADGAF